MASDEDRMVEVVADAIVDHAWITESDSRRIAELVLEALTAAGWGDVSDAERRGRTEAAAVLAAQSVEEFPGSIQVADWLLARGGADPANDEHWRSTAEALSRLERVIREAERRGREAAIAELRSDAAFLDWRADPAVAHRHVSSYDRESCALFLEAQTKPVEVGG